MIALVCVIEVRWVDPQKERERPNSTDSYYWDLDSDIPTFGGKKREEKASLRESGINRINK